MTPTARVDLRAQAPLAAVWEVLDDGWTYASWVVGTSRIRSVDADWPRPGSKLHHSFGVWPVVINDTTEVLDVEPGRRLRLKARGWPTGEAIVEITTTARGTGETDLSIEEDVSSGPALVVPKIVRQTFTVPRNRETLRRLALISCGRATGGPASV